MSQNGSYNFHVKVFISKVDLKTCKLLKLIALNMDRTKRCALFRLILPFKSNKETITQRENPFKKKKGSNLFPAVVTVTRTWCASRRSAVHNSQGADTLKQAVKAGVMNSVRLHTKSAQTRHVKNWTVTAINNMDTQHCKWGLLTRQKNCVRIVSSSCVWHTAVSLHLKQKGQSLVKRDGQRREVRVGRDQVKVFT